LGKDRRWEEDKGREWREKTREKVQKRVVGRENNGL
jgi:hypothetical protein